MERRLGRDSTELTLTDLSCPDHWVRPSDLKAASVAQREIADACVLHDDLRPGDVAGADTSMKWRDSHGPIHAAIAPLDAPPLTVTRLPPFPYVPGYLGFREAPALTEAWSLFDRKPGLLLVDGHGISHPRRCGIATHLGVVLDVPSIGVAKTLLCGEVMGAVGPDPGDSAPLLHRGETVGVALRTSRRGTPIFVSIGHRVSLETAVDRVLALAGGRRLPLPIRLAHDAANAARRRWEAGS